MTAAAGRTGFALVGTVVGFAIGGPFGAQIGLAVGTLAGSLIFPPEGKIIEGPRLDDLKVSFSSYGKPIPRIYGKMEVGGNVAWSPGLVEHRVEENESSGKGAGPSVTTITFLYTASFRIIYGDANPNPAQAILKNWADGKLIRDRTGSGPTQVFLDADVPGNQAIRDFLGESTQLPGPAEQADEGIANVGAYRFQVSQEYEDMPVGDFGNRIPQITAEVAMVANDTLPFKIITPPTNITSSGFQFSPSSTEGYMLEDGFGNNEANRISLLSEEVIETITYASSDNIYAVDDLGHMWGSTGFGVDQHFQVYNASTGEFIASTDIAAALGGIVSQFILINGGLNGAIAVGANDKLCRLNRVEGTVIRNLRDNNTGYDFSTYFPGLHPVLGADGITLDTLTGDIWVSYGILGDGVLYRIDGASEDPEEKITFSGRPIELITYDEGTNSLLVYDGNGFFRFSLDSRTITSTIVHALSPANQNRAAWKVIDGRLMYLQESLTGATGIYDISGDEIVRIGSIAPTDWVGGASNWEHPTYDPVGHALIVTGTSGGDFGKYAWLFLDRAEGTDITVRSIVEDISLLVDYVAGTDIDATALTDTLPGYIVRNRMTARKALEPLATAFNFRSVESDFKIKFPKRGGASVGDIPQIDLGATAGETPTTQPLRKVRITEDQLFETVIIEYIDPTFDNNPNTQQAKRIREAIDVGGSLIFNFPGSLGNDQAKQIIERILFQAWAGRTGVETAVPLKHILKDPGDVVTITKDGKVVQVELSDVKLGANSIIKLSGTIDDSVVHVSTATGVGALGVETQVIVISGATELFILDIPLLRDLDNGEGIYVGAGTPEGVSWPGAQIFRGSDGVSFTPYVGIVPSRDLDYGRATTTLADASPNVWDRTNSLTISLTSGVLSSDTETNVLNGTNVLLVGTGAKAEIIQFKTAVLNADGTYTISVLLRGRRGTDYATGTHAANETVIVLAASTVLRTSVNLSEHLSTFFYKAITVGGSQFSSPTIQDVLTLRSQMPYAPAHIAGTISGDDWTFTLVRRTRIGGSWKNLSGTPPGESSENYEWDVMDGATVKRTLTSSTPSVIYTSADQVTDFGDNQTTIELNVHQISDTVGRGFVSNVTLVGG